MKQSERPPTPCEKAVWRNVGARFPGFTDEVAKFYWGLVDDDGLKAGSPEFSRMLLAKWPDGIDVEDLAERNDRSATKLSQDIGVVCKWADVVLTFHCYIESVLDGSEPVPIKVADGWHMADQLVELKRENARLGEQLKILTEKQSAYRDSIKSVPEKRISSIYKLICGISINKYKYTHNKNNQATSNIKNILDKVTDVEKKIDCSLDEDTIRKILRDAYSHVTGAADTTD